jgi:hypothetical protein
MKTHATTPLILTSICSAGGDRKVKSILAPKPTHVEAPLCSVNKVDKAHPDLIALRLRRGTTTVLFWLCASHAAAWPQISAVDKPE